MENLDFADMIKDIPTENVYVLTEKNADTWEEPKDSIEAWFTMYLKVAGL